MLFRAELLAAPRSDRYRIEAFLGRGATSLVYRALDLETDLTVALKSIRFPGQEDIYRIKQEFRFFRDFYHQNLVMFYDLHVADDSCFYTMELVEGVDLVSFVAGDERRLRVAFRQLATAISAVHEAGRLHRDLKPGNIIVEPSERTVLLDFGLAAEATSGSLKNETQVFGGTPGYMAPEQVRGESATRASDLYAIGVVLYESLTGRLPYVEASTVALYEAQKTPPRPPNAFNPQAPADLGDLAMRLLAFDPTARPSLGDLMSALSEGARQLVGGRAAGSPRGVSFIGRNAELARLEGAWERALAGERMVACVNGVSGVGKTTLIERFLERARERDGALLFYARCHPQESVRHNAVDGLIDQLSRYLLTESADRLAELAPGDLSALMTMFPVLGRVPWPRSDVEPDLPNDPRILAHAGVQALRRLMETIAVGRPLALWVDDLQWSDASSMPILDSLTAEGTSRAIFPIFSYRTDIGLPQSVTDALQASAASIERIALAPLSTAETAALVATLAQDEDAGWLAEATRASAGLPFLAVQFASRSGGRETSDPEDSSATPTALMTRRLSALPEEQLRVLEVVAVAARPLDEAKLLRILSRLSASARDVYRLLKQNLLRRADGQGRGAIETAHDIIREAVLEDMPQAVRRARHRDIAEMLLTDAILDHPLLVEHFLGAGENDAAREHAILASRAARERLMFGQAVEFLELAVRLRDPPVDDAALTGELAQALADAGRSAEAADLFMRAAEADRADEATAASFIDRAAQQMLYSGRLVEGHAAYRKLFVGLGVGFPKTAPDALRMSLLNRTMFALRLHRLGRAPAGDPKARLDTLWAAAKGFLVLDYVVGDAIFTRFLREAVAVGDPSRLMRALALEAAVMANIGRRWSFRRAERLLRRAEALSAAAASSYDRMALATCQTGIAWHRGDWAEAARLARQTLAAHRKERVRYDFELAIVQSYLGSALVLSGAIAEAKTNTLAVVEDALVRGDVYVSRFFRSSFYVYIALADDDAETVIAESEAMLRDLPADRFTSLHWAHFLATVNALVYSGRAWEAWALVQRQWPSIVEAHFPQLGMIGLQVREVRARAALAAASAGAPPPGLAAWTRGRLLRTAEQDARRVARLRALVCAPAIAAAIRSGAARLQGDEAARKRWLAKAARGFAVAGMALHRASADAERGDEAARSPALRAMEQAGVKRADRMSAFLVFAL